MAQFKDVVSKDPSAAARYYTFGYGDIIGKISDGAVSQYNSELKRLESAGFKREKKSTQKEVQKENADDGKQDQSGSPKPKAGLIPPADQDQGGKPNLEGIPHLKNLSGMI